jgi:hypothetical protein
MMMDSPWSGLSEEERATAEAEKPADNANAPDDPWKMKYEHRGLSWPSFTLAPVAPAEQERDYRRALRRWIVGRLLKKAVWSTVEELIAGAAAIEAYAADGAKPAVAPAAPPITPAPTAPKRHWLRRLWRPHA